VPVVSSHLAAGGVDAIAPDHLLAATTPAEYAEAILHVLENPAERARLSRAGRARMLSHHAWPQSMRRLDAIVERCLSLSRSERALAATS
jgi:glycosyltransferase involved in cell wall biosynthesis